MLYLLCRYSWRSRCSLFGSSKWSTFCVYLFAEICLRLFRTHHHHHNHHCFRLCRPSMWPPNNERHSVGSFPYRQSSLLFLIRTEEILSSDSWRLLRTSTEIIVTIIILRIIITTTKNDQWLFTFPPRFFSSMNYYSCISFTYIFLDICSFKRPSSLTDYLLFIVFNDLMFISDVACFPNSNGSTISVHLDHSYYSSGSLRHCSTAIASFCQV